MRLAGTIELADVVVRLRVQRPVFHSKAELQHAFAWAAHELDPEVQVRLEMQLDPHIRLGLLLSGPDLGRTTAIELKYLTAGWGG